MRRRNNWVTVSRIEVSAFADTWPSNNLQDKAISFEFENNGDLIDMSPRTLDGPDVAALADDARTFFLGGK